VPLSLLNKKATVQPILHIISGLATGGAERQLAILIEHGLARDYDNYVLSLRGGGPMVDVLCAAGANVRTLNLRDKPIRDAMQLIALVRSLRPALVHGWMYHGNIAATVAALCATDRVPTVWGIRQGLDYPEGDTAMTRRIIRIGALLSPRAAAIVYNAERSRNQHEALGYSRVRSKVIDNGFEISRFAANSHLRSRVREELGFHEDAVVVANFARLHSVKDHQTLLRALAMALPQCPALVALLTGRDVSPKTLNLDEHLSSTLQSRIKIMGERNDVSILMQAADIYVSSSRAEAFPNVVGEAMAASRPVIATDVGDTMRLVGTGGIVLPPSDPTALGRAIVALVNDPARRADLGTRGYSRMEEQFDVHAVVERYQALYRELINSGT
jgi:glycosyltransferase involved in cell wall biosynthesis